MIEGKRPHPPWIMCRDSLNMQCYLNAHMLKLSLIPRLHLFMMKMSGDYWVFPWLCQINNLDFWISEWLYVGSPQSENLCNFVIALHILRIPRFHSNVEIAQLKYNLLIAQLKYNLLIAQIILAVYSWYRRWLANCSNNLKGWKTR